MTGSDVVVYMSSWGVSGWSEMLMSGLGFLRGFAKRCKCQVNAQATHFSVGSTALLGHWYVCV